MPGIRVLAIRTVAPALVVGLLGLPATHPATADADRLLSRGRPAVASSVENSSLSAAGAVDGDMATRWSSQFADPQWIQVDLGATATIHRVRLSWETAYGKAYRIETSSDGRRWTRIYSTRGSDGGVDDLTGLSGSGRYVRMYGTGRGTQWGYSLWELEVYGVGGSGGEPNFRVAPYVATFIGADLARLARESGQRVFSLGFVNGTGDCQPVWSADDAALRRSVADLRAMGGDIIVSSGGWNADDLVRHCRDGRSVAAAYQRVLDAYDASYLDLDPEHGDRYNNLEPAIVDQRSEALRILQDNARARGRTLRISLTLGVSPDAGFNGENLYVVRSAIDHGVEVDVVNPMTMDFYDGRSGDQMGARSIQALRKVRDQLATLYPGRTDAQLWGMIAATPMIGQNDDQREVFTLDDARTLLRFAREKNMARLSFWAINRDNGNCPGKRQADATCSGIQQGPYEFTRIFRQLTG